MGQVSLKIKTKPLSIHVKLVKSEKTLCFFFFFPSQIHFPEVNQGHLKTVFFPAILNNALTSCSQGT